MNFLFCLFVCLTWGWVHSVCTIRVGFDAQRAVCTISFYRLCSLVCVCMRFQTFYQIRCPLIGLLHASRMGFLFVQLFNLFSIIQFECIYIVCASTSQNTLFKTEFVSFYNFCVCAYGLSNFLITLVSFGWLAARVFYLCNSLIYFQ